MPAIVCITTLTPGFPFLLCHKGTIFFTRDLEVKLGILFYFTDTVIKNHMSLVSDYFA